MDRAESDWQRFVALHPTRCQSTCALPQYVKVVTCVCESNRHVQPDANVRKEQRKGHPNTASPDERRRESALPLSKTHSVQPGSLLSADMVMPLSQTTLVTQDKVRHPPNDAQTNSIVLRPDVY